MVAIALGWLFYREPFGWLEAVAMLLSLPEWGRQALRPSLGRRPKKDASAPPTVGITQQATKKDTRISAMPLGL